jgi:hypothetical protein
MKRYYQMCFDAGIMSCASHMLVYYGLSVCLSLKEYLLHARQGAQFWNDTCTGRCEYLCMHTGTPMNNGRVYMYECMHLCPNMMHARTDFRDRLRAHTFSTGTSWIIVFSTTLQHQLYENLDMCARARLHFVMPFHEPSKHSPRICTC